MVRPHLLAQGLCLALLALALGGCREQQPVPMAGVASTPAPLVIATPATSRVASTPSPTVILHQPLVAEIPPVPITPLPPAPPLPRPTPIPVKAPLVALPAPQLLTSQGRALLLEFEVGGGKSYYDKLLARPTWPEFASGVTIGIGYDLGYNSPAVIAEDWSELPQEWVKRLVSCAGITGQKAKGRIAALRDIVIPWDVSMRVFERVTVTKFRQLCVRTWPEYRELTDTCQDSLLSLTFNRGNSMVGEKRKHMRAIRDLCPSQDYPGIAGQERAMVVIWRGTTIEAGMHRRRFAEALVALLPDTGR